MRSPGPGGRDVNTPTHVLMGMAAFGSPKAPKLTVAAALGGLLPDGPAILMVLWASRVQGYGPGMIFGTLYFSPSWQALLAPWHSVPLWALVLALGLYLRSPATEAFPASGLLHQACDFPVHADDPHRHFWPLSDWRFHSPVSYWDPRHYGRLFEPFEFALTLGLLAFLAWRYRSPWLRGALGLLALAYVAQRAAFTMMF